MSFVLVAKPDDHKIMMEWVQEQKQLREVSCLEYKDLKERLHVYKWINNALLNGNQILIGLATLNIALCLEKKSRISFRA